MEHEWLAKLKNQPRLLSEAELRPLQGKTFQATGFPDLGPARYQLPNGTEMLLVESAQSVANHLELAVWDMGKETLIDDLLGLPYIRVFHVKDQSKEMTNSILEAHRINSEYIMKKGSNFRTAFEQEIAIAKGSMVDWKRFYKTLFKYDPNSLIHGCFLEEIDGRLRVTRALTRFIQARDILAVESGGVKINILEPTLKRGEGNVPFHRVEFTAKQITAYFSLDLALLCSYGLDNDAVELLVGLSLLKVRRFLSRGLRLRTACDLETIDGLKVVRPEGFAVPTEEVLLPFVKKMIQACAHKGLFADPALTRVQWKPVGASGGPGAQSAADQSAAGADAT